MRLLAKDGFQRQVRIQMVFFKPFPIKNPRHISNARIAKQGGDDLSGASFARQPDGSGKIDARRQADE